MSVPKKLEEAVSRLEEARWRVDIARRKLGSPQSQQEWLSALTDVTAALSDIEQANNESIHEKLHQLSRHVGLGEFHALVQRRRGSPKRPVAPSSSIPTKKK